MIESSIKFSKSIIVKLVLIFFTGVSLVIIISGAITIALQQQDNLVSYRQNTQFVFNQIMALIARDLWSWEQEKVISYLDTMMDEDIISGIILHDMYGEPLYAALKSEGAVESRPIEDLESTLRAEHILVSEIKYEGGVVGTLKVFFNTRSMQEKLSRIIIAAVIQAILLILSITLLVYFSVRILIIRKVILLSDKLKEVSQGKGDLTVELRSGEDELGELSGYFNAFIGMMKNMISNLKTTVAKALDLSQSLAGSTEQSSVTFQGIHNNIEHIETGLNQLHTEIEKISAVSGELTDFSKLVAEKARNQFSDVNEASASVDEIISSIQSISQTVDTKLKIITRNFTLANQGSEVMNETQQNIAEINKSTALIADMLEVINGIAGQTNLLAMNAAIEAAHAGNAGRGFAVVADEIRKLSENTAQQAHMIGMSLKEIVSRIEHTNQSANSSSATFLNMVTGINDVKQGMEEVQLAIKELSQNSTHVMDTLSSLISSGDKLQESSGNMTDRVNNIFSSLKSISTISISSRDRINEVSAAHNEILSSIQHISRIGQENKQNITLVNNLIKNFKTR